MSKSLDSQEPHLPEDSMLGQMSTFLRPLITSPFIEVGKFTFYSDLLQDPKLWETRNALYFFGPEKLIIGKFCSLAMGSRFIGNQANHLTFGNSTYPPFLLPGALSDAQEIMGLIRSRGDTVVGNDVWVGSDAIVMPGVTIGHGAIIGARAVVTSDVPAYGVVVGNPGRMVKKRFSDENIALLLRIAWWDWPIKAITEHRRAIMLGTPADVEKIAVEFGLLSGAS